MITTIGTIDAKYEYRCREHNNRGEPPHGPAVVTVGTHRGDRDPAKLCRACALTWARHLTGAVKESERCTCDRFSQTGEGPDDDCPQHGCHDHSPDEN